MDIIKLTDSAKKYITSVAKTQEKPYVWFGVDGGGCSGFTYKWDFTDAVDEGFVIECGDGISLIVDKVSEMYVLGSTIDYVTELSGSFLKVINPLADSSCGCGESFNVKF